MSLENSLWWQRGVIYHVYPRSFADQTGDGIGDLAGITARLPYLVELGVDAVWISPIFPSPMADFGYDVADYCDVDPLFGTLADLDALVARSHALGLRVILDFVPNHTSDAHPWFTASRAARDDPKRDWYIWRDPAPGGGPPTNWLAHFGGSAWSWVEETRQFYLHSFLSQQPDLNWRNPAVVEAMLDVLRFWLERGIDGFRVDVLWLLIKDDRLRDNPPNPAYVPGRNSYERLIPLYTSDRPETQRLVEAMRAVLDSYGERVLIGEIYLPLERLVSYYGSDSSGAHLPFNFHLIGAAWRASSIAAIITEYERLLPPGAWPNWVLGNHDQSRLATRVGPAQARIAAMLLLTLRGTPTLYYGDEIGMIDVGIGPADARDPAERNQPGLGLGRDPERTPMQWDATPGAGFTAAVPWLPIGDHERTNVATQLADPHSLLALYRALLTLRRARPALWGGAISEVRAQSDVLVFTRWAGDARLTIALNFGDTDQTLHMAPARVVLSTGLDRAGDSIDGHLSLRGGEGVILELTPHQDDAPP